MEQAIQHYQQALEIAREIGDRRGEGNCLGNLGNAYADLGQVEQAIQHYQQALEIAREIGDRRGEGHDLGNLGIAYRTWARWSRPSSTTSRRWRSPGRSATGAAKGPGLGNLGNAYRNLGQVEQAIQHYQQALEIAREIGDRRGEGPLASWAILGAGSYEEQWVISPGAIAAMQVLRRLAEREIGHR